MQETLIECLSGDRINNKYRQTQKMNMTADDLAKRLANPETLTDQDLHAPMQYFKRHNCSPKVAKYEMRKWAFNPNDKTIDIVDEAARRLGLGPNECLSEKK